jgi:hypothetical protein
MTGPGLIRRVVVPAVMAAVAVWCALRWNPAMAVAVWSGLAAGLCGIGAVLLARQPVGMATASGQVGAGFLRWGYRVGRGKLPGIVLVSWLIWSVLGAAVIGMTAFRAEPRTPWMILSWAIDGMALLYLVGVALINPRRAGALLVPLAVVLGMIAGSALLWRTGTESAQEKALLIGGAPIPVLALGYALMMGAMMLGGRKGGWK